MKGEGEEPENELYSPPVRMREYVENELYSPVFGAPGERGSLAVERLLSRSLLPGLRGGGACDGLVAVSHPAGHHREKRSSGDQLLGRISDRVH